MDKGDARPVICLSCSVFHPELTHLAERGVLDLRVRYLSSSMHMVPGKLDRRMQDLMAAERKRGNRVLLVYGDCHPHMHDLERAEDVARICGLHCGEILLGKQRYKQLLREGTFLLLREWTMRWRELLMNLGGLDQATTKELMRERHSKFVYLDTGTGPVPLDQIRACAAHFGLPFEIEQVTLEYFQTLIKDARGRLDASS